MPHNHSSSKQSRLGARANPPRHIYTQPETTSEAAESSRELDWGNCLELVPLTQAKSPGACQAVRACPGTALPAQKRL